MSNTHTQTHTENTPTSVPTPAGACVRWVPDTPTVVHLIPRPGAVDESGAPLRSRTYKAPPLFVFHHANAYESDDGKVIIDSIHYDSLPAVGREALVEQRVSAGHAEILVQAVHMQTSVLLAAQTVFLV